MSNEFVIANFKHVADGLQEGQFAVGERKGATSLDDLDPMYRELLDRKVTVTMAVIGPDGRPGLTPMWFDHENDKILVNTASHRPKCGWIRKNPQITILVVNPDNPYHWVSIKCTVENELHEDGPDGARVTAQLNRIWRKYTGDEGDYGLRDPPSTRSVCCSSAGSTGSRRSGSRKRRPTPRGAAASAVAARERGRPTT